MSSNNNNNNSNTNSGSVFLVRTFLSDVHALGRNAAGLLHHAADTVFPSSDATEQAMSAAAAAAAAQAIADQTFFQHQLQQQQQTPVHTCSRSALDTVLKTRVSPPDLAVLDQSECSICQEPLLRQPQQPHPTTTAAPAQTAPAQTATDSADCHCCRMPCAHVFHRSCIRTWLNTYSHVCPVCRYELPTAQEDDNNNNNVRDDNNNDHHRQRTRRRRSPRYTRQELEAMSVPQLKQLLSPVSSLSIPRLVLTKHDLVQFLIDSNAVELIQPQQQQPLSTTATTPTTASPRPSQSSSSQRLALRLSELQVKSVRELVNLMDQAGLPRSAQLLEKSDLVQTLIDTGIVQLLPERSATASSSEPRFQVETVGEEEEDDDWNDRVNNANDNDVDGNNNNSHASVVVDARQNRTLVMEENVSFTETTPTAAAVTDGAADAAVVRNNLNHTAVRAQEEEETNTNRTASRSDRSPPPAEWVDVATESMETDVPSLQTQDSSTATTAPPPLLLLPHFGSGTQQQQENDEDRKPAGRTDPPSPPPHAEDRFLLDCIVEADDTMKTDSFSLPVARANWSQGGSSSRRRRSQSYVCRSQDLHESEEEDCKPAARDNDDDRPAEAEFEYISNVTRDPFLRRRQQDDENNDESFGPAAPIGDHHHIQVNGVARGHVVGAMDESALDGEDDEHDRATTTHAVNNTFSVAQPSLVEDGPNDDDDDTLQVTAAAAASNNERWSFDCFRERIVGVLNTEQLEECASHLGVDVSAYLSERQRLDSRLLREMNDAALSHQRRSSVEEEEVLQPASTTPQQQQSSWLLNLSIPQLRSLARLHSIDLTGCLQRSEMANLLHRTAGDEAFAIALKAWSVSDIRALASVVEVDLSQCENKDAMIATFYRAVNLRPHMASYLMALSPMVSMSIAELRGTAREWQVNVSDCLERGDILHRLFSSKTIHPPTARRSNG